MNDEVWIQRRFKITAKDGSIFSDAIMLSQTDYETLTEKDIANIKQERLVNWMIVKNTPPPEPTKQEILDKLAAEKQYLQDQVVQADVQIAEVTAEVTPKGK
jgi:hypothetical protein